MNVAPPDVAIRVRQVGKAFRRYPRKWGRLAEWLGSGPRHELKWALRDITFDVSRGEAVGLIGLNGAGKSTLLKIITGTTRTTQGSVEVNGAVSALLELGIGFHPDFTGRQNVYMAGQLRGISRETLDGLLPDIERFADIGDYLDQPLRTYSSGMQVRLAFATATAVRPDILIVDEALSVGDILFQQKCFERIRGFREQGTTLLFVSHSMGAVYSLCDRALLLHGGHVAIDGSPREAIDLYNALVLRHAEGSAATLAVAGAPPPVPRAELPAESVAGMPSSVSPPTVVVDEIDDGGGSPVATVTAGAQVGSYSAGAASSMDVQLRHDGTPVQSVVSDSDVELVVTARFARSFTDPHIGFQIRDRRGEALFMTNTHCMGLRVGSVAEGESVVVRFGFRAAFSAGDYTVTAGIADGGLLEGQFRQSLERKQDVLAFTVLRNMDSILWSGVYNITPTCAVQRGPRG